MNGEVLAPAGSLDHALWALEGGADAVYVGFQKFSARSHADNLSLDDMARLTAVAKARGAKVYCAVNTILGVDEVVEAVELAWQLHLRGVDALIVQDVGLASALRRHGPPVALHASTQAAVHNSGGVAAIKAMGFTRVVLARELTMDEIGRIVADDPAMEYEVFVHGALCYAVSGNCMASGMMIGRSANRGDCGQICRTKFELDYLIPGPQRRASPHEQGLPEGVHAPPGELTWKRGTVGAFASMNDLELGSRIRELRGLGVASFKIEGRMKPPAYSYNTARAYRAFLDGGNDAEAWGWLDEARLRFGRLPSAGWFDGHKALAQTNPSWAGTLGMPLGPVTGVGERSVGVESATRAKVLSTLGRGDGVMILGAVPGQTFRGALAGGVTMAGDRAELPLADQVPFDAWGGTLWLVSRHDGKLPVKKAGRPWRHPVAMEVRLEATALEGLPALLVRISSPAFGGFFLTQTLAAEAAGDADGLVSKLTEIFHASDSAFAPGPFTLENAAGAWFVPPRVLKELRRRWYTLVEARAGAFVAAAAETLRFEATSEVVLAQAGKAPPRGGLSPQQGVNKLTGFIVEWESLRADQLVATAWGLALPLAPFTPNEASYFERLREFLHRLRRDGVTEPVFPGLSNPCHLTWIQRLRDEGWRLDAWFADWGFHSANPWTPFQLEQSLSGLAFAVPWLEEPNPTDRSYFPPLFTSRACLLRNSFGEQNQPSSAPTSGPGSFHSRDWLQTKLAGQAPTRPESGPRCPAGCAGHFSARLLQGKKQFRVEARDCINYLILEQEAPLRPSSG